MGPSYDFLWMRYAFVELAICVQFTMFFAGHKVKQLQGEVTLSGGGGGHRETRDQVSSLLFLSLLLHYCVGIVSP